MTKQDVKKVQDKILETMKYIDKICREYDIEYFIMGGTALGAVRHEGFIPWDDDLDIFMTPANYRKFYSAFKGMKTEKYILQEWGIIEEYLEYAKVRMNGTTFIEEAFKDRKNMHHGIYVDIMILHKCPNKKIIQRMIYVASKYVTLVGLSERNWKPKNIKHKLGLLFIKTLPNKFISKKCYELIYKYDNLEEEYSYFYFITKAKFSEGIFPAEIFDNINELIFEDTLLKAPMDIKEYLKTRYGNYMQMPSEKERSASVHAKIYDTKKGYENYIS